MIKKLNLLPPELIKRDELIAKQWMVRSMFVFGVSLFLLLVGLGKFQLYRIDQQIAMIEQEEKTLKTAFHEVVQVEERIQELESKIVQLQENKLEQVAASTILMELSKVIPEDIWLSSLEVVSSDLNLGQDNQLSTEQEQADVTEQAQPSNTVPFKLLMEGYGESLPSISLLVYQMNKQPHFAGVFLESSEEMEIQGVKLVYFKLQGEIIP